MSNIISTSIGRDMFIEITFSNGEKEVVRLPADGSTVEIKNKDISDIKEVRSEEGRCCNNNSR